MRIGMVYPVDPAVGIGTYAKQMCSAISKIADVKHVKVSDQNHAMSPSVDAIGIKNNVLADYEKAAHWINSNCDVCMLHHGFSVYGVSDGVFMIQLVASLNVPLVTIWHEVSHLANGHQRFVGEKIGKYSTSSIVMSSQAANVLEHVFKIHAENIKVLPYGACTKPAISRETLKQKLGMGDCPVLMSFGQLDGSLGIDKILDAVSILAMKNPRILYVHVGTTSRSEQNRETYRRQLLIKARNLNINGHIHFINYDPSQNELVEYLAACDICLFGHSDALLVQLHEMALAMSAGVAIVSHPFSYAIEMLGDKMGELVHFDNAPDLAGRIHNLMADHHLMEIYRQAVSDFGSHFQWDKVLPRYKAVWQEAAGDFITFCRPTHQNRSQLLVDFGLLPCFYSHTKRLTVSEAAWSLFATTIYQSLIGDGRFRVDENALEHLVVLDPKAMSNPRSEHDCDEEFAFAAFAVAHWIRSHSEESYVEKAVIMVERISSHLEQTTSVSANAFVVMALNECLDIFPENEKLNSGFKKHSKPLRTLFQAFPTDGVLPEKLTDRLPSVKIWAYWNAISKDTGKESVEIEKLLIYQLIDKMFGEGCFFSLSSSTSYTTRPKRSGIKQGIDDVLFSAMLCRSLGIAFEDNLLLERAIQCYTWFLGENNVRKSIFDEKTGNCAVGINGLEVDPACSESANKMFVSVLAIAHDANFRLL
ncbi:MAG: hypothetical protein QM786_09785 [Breznakibacter sp.]